MFLPISIASWDAQNWPNKCNSYHTSHLLPFQCKWSLWTLQICLRYRCVLHLMQSVKVYDSLDVEAFISFLAPLTLRPNGNHILWMIILCYFYFHYGFPGQLLSQYEWLSSQPERFQHYLLNQKSQTWRIWWNLLLLQLFLQRTKLVEMIFI